MALSGFNSIITHLAILAPQDSPRLWRASLRLSRSKARLYLGVSAWPGADNAAYRNIGTAKVMEVVARYVKSMDLGNLGGVIFWDGPEGMLNENEGNHCMGKDGIGDVTNNCCLN